MTNFAVAPGALGIGSPIATSRLGAAAARLARLVRRSAANTVTPVATPPASAALPTSATTPTVGSGGGSVAAALDVVAFGAPAGHASSTESSVEIPVSCDEDRPSAAATEPVHPADRHAAETPTTDLRTVEDLTCSWPQFVKGTDLTTLRWMDTPDGPCLVGQFVPPVPKNLSR